MRGAGNGTGERGWWDIGGCERTELTVLRLSSLLAKRSSPDSVSGQDWICWKMEGSFADESSLSPTTRPDISIDLETASIDDHPNLCTSKILLVPFPIHRLPVLRAAMLPPPNRLYTKGRILGHKRGKRNSRPNQSLIAIEGVDTKEDARAYFGKVSEVRSGIRMLWVVRVVLEVVDWELLW